MTRSSTAERPVIGFVVEGDAEKASFPGLVARIVGAPAHVQVAHTRGYGGILNNLEEHLDDLIGNWHPLTLVVTVDLRDIIAAGMCASCTELIERIQAVVDAWIGSRAGSIRMQPLPEHIVIVVQIPTLEAWWLADAAGLSQLDVFSLDVEKCQWVNVDDEVANPASFVRQCCTREINLKSPALAKAVFGSLSIEKMQECSRSFRKFAKEVVAGYDRWYAKLLHEQAAE